MLPFRDEGIDPDEHREAIDALNAALDTAFP
jgi:hypothetical protein